MKTSAKKMQFKSKMLGQMETVRYLFVFVTILMMVTFMWFQT